MYTTLLVLHLIGVSIGAGTGVYLGAVSRHSARNLELAEAKTIMPGIAAAISGVGNIGLLLLLGSGLLMIASLGIQGLSGFFWIKMALVGMLLVYLVFMKRWAARARNDAGSALRMKQWAFIGPPLGMMIIVSAVMAFHA